jgi:DNA-binding transcriptional ArsR family regulator
MRPLIHPSIEDITVEGILHVLSDPVRVAIYAQMANAGCAFNCTNFSQVSDKTIPKSTLSQHFRALREAGLIRSERHGVEMQNTTRCEEIDKRFPGLLSAVMNAYTAQMMDQARGGKRRSASKAKAG